MLEPEEQGEPTPELRDYLRVVIERWWVIAISIAFIMAVLLASALTSTPMYRSSAELVFQTNTLDRAVFGSQVFGTDNVERSIETGAKLVTTEAVADAVKQELDTDLSAGTLASMIDVESSTTTNMLEIKAVSADPQLAADVANAFATQFVNYKAQADKNTVAAARELVKQKLDSLDDAVAESDYGLMLKEKYENLEILEAMQTGGFSIVETAYAPGAPFSPRPLRSGVLGLAGGLVLGLMLAFLLNYLDRRLKSTKAVEAAFGLPVLASFPAVGHWTKRRDANHGREFVGFRSHPSLLESFRALRSSLQYFDVEKRTKSILITSGLPSEGKTTTTVNLALSMVLAGHRVVIVEADLRRPMVGQYLQVYDGVGISTLLAGHATMTDALQLVNTDAYLPEGIRDKVERTGGRVNPASSARALFCLASGPLPPNPAELLSSDRMARLLEEMTASEKIDYILIDTPPILSVADALVLADKVDAVVLTCKINGTTRDEAEEVSERFSRTGARLIGVVAAGAKTRGSSYQRRSQYYSAG